MKRWSLAVGIFSSLVLVASPSIAFAQHGSGGGHSGGHAGSGGSGHSASGSHSSISSSSSIGSRGDAGNHASVVAYSGRSERSTASESTGSSSGGILAPAPNDTWLGNDAREEQPARVVTLGFPHSTGETLLAASSSSTHAAFVGERDEIREEQVQRPIRPVSPPQAPKPMAPVTAPRPTSTPVVAPHTSVRIRSLTRIPNRPALWFLAPQADNGGRLWRRRFRGGFGIFGGFFGWPFAFGFGPDCNPFWSEPLAFGCNGFGLNFGGIISSSEEQPPAGTEEVAPEEEPEQSIFVPPPEGSSPEEIQAEKILFVLYMKDGSVYAVTNYWIADGKLHYLTSYGGENTIEMSDLDLQKTVDVNSKRGVDFTLKPRTDQTKPDVPQQ